MSRARSEVTWFTVGQRISLVSSALAASLASGGTQGGLRPAEPKVRRGGRRERPAVCFKFGRRSGHKKEERKISQQCYKRKMTSTREISQKRVQTEESRKKRG